LRLWVVSHGTPSLKYPLHGIFQFEQAKAIAKEADGQVFFIEVDLRSFRRLRKWGYRFYIKEGIQICSIRIPCGPLPERILNEIGALAFRWLYKKIVKRFGSPDIVHAHFTGQAYMVAKILDKTIPLVITEHSSSIIKPSISPETMRIASIAYSRANWIITVSRFLGDRIAERFGFDSEIIPNMYDISLFNYSECIKRQSPYQVVSVGNLINSKHMDVTIQAFGLFQRKFPDSVLTICGGGLDRDALEKLIAYESLQESVILMGACSPQQVAKILSKANLFVLASEYETFGVVFIEALACGVPLVGTSCGGPEDIINEGNGILVQVNDYPALAEAMITVASKPERYNSTKLSQEAIMKYSPHAVAQQILKIYEKCGIKLEERL